LALALVSARRRGTLLDASSSMKWGHWIAGATFTVAFFIAGFAHAQVVQQTNAWAQVDTGDSNTTFYIGTTTAATVVDSVGVFVRNPSGLGASMQVRLTCFANQFNVSQTGCTTTSALTTASSTIYNTAAQVVYFSYTSPVTLQSGKVYVMEIMLSSGSGSFDVYGDTVYQFNNQCNFAGGGNDCSGAPYFTFNSLPNWTGINATNTPLLALYNNNATQTLEAIQTRCVKDGLVDFGYAMCSAFAFLFVPDTAVYASYNQALDTAKGQFPVSWYYGIKDTYEGLTASSTANMATVSINFQSVDPATSTPFGNILPNATVLSSSTISTYLSPSLLALVLTLETAAIWVLFSMFLFHDVQRRFFRH